MQDKFIEGQEPLNDKSWDKYIQTIEKMGLEEYMKVNQDAYERYLSAG